jgi:hypothetical protein
MPAEMLNHRSDRDRTTGIIGIQPYQDVASRNIRAILGEYTPYCSPVNAPARVNG